MKKTIIALLITSTILANGKTFQTEDQFSITLPDDWIEVPKEVLNAYSESISNLTPSQPKQVYDYGYQQAGAENWLIHPYILVQVKNTGRIASGELQQYRKLKSQIEKGVKEIADDLAAILSNTTIGAPVYDEEHTMLWMSMSSEVQEVGTIQATIGVKLTEQGIIQLNGYSKQEEADKFTEIYTHAFANLDVDDSQKYKPQITDSAPIFGGINTGKILAAAINGALIGGLFSIFILLKKKKNKTDS
jgi:hypothetical protein